MKNLRKAAGTNHDYYGYRCSEIMVFNRTWSCRCRIRYSLRLPRPCRV